MAIRAEEDALLEFGLDAGPRARYTVLGDAERLRLGAGVVEVEERRRAIPLTESAAPAHQSDGPLLVPLTIADNRMT
jgi:hypothetical protein